jgi:cell division protein FtsA
MMEGIVEAAEEILGMPVRVGFPVGVKGIVQLVQGPQWAAGVGLVHYGAQRLAEARQYGEDAAEAAGAEVVPPRRVQSGGLWQWLRAAF